MHSQRPGAPAGAGRAPSGPRLGGRALLALLAAGLVLLAAPSQATWAGSPLYPDLRTLAPKDLRLDTVVIDGARHHVLRFTNTVWNLGPGRLEVRGESSPETGTTLVYQRVYDTAGGFVEYPVGEFVFHADHRHWHVGDFAEFQLWTRAAYTAWQAAGKPADVPPWRMSKISSCLVDSQRVRMLAGTPRRGAYTRCDTELQGISVGWGDIYRSNLPDQWVDLGEAPLADGSYVLRSVVDPLNRIYESEGKADPRRESATANAAAVAFRVVRGRILLSRR